MSEAPRQDTPAAEVATPAVNQLKWSVGFILLAVAAFASGIMSLKSMGVLGMNLPGCGAESACDAVSNGPFGSIPGLDWPVSYFGFAWFAGMLMAWTWCEQGVPAVLRTFVRLSTAGSLMFLVVMIIKGTLCPYCLTTHLCNIAFWLLVESLPAIASARQMRPSLIGWTAAFCVVSIALGAGTAHREAIMEPVHAAARAANEQALLDAVTSNTGKGGEAQGTSSSAFTGRYLRGPEDADIQIVMFSDYQCPDCRAKEMEISRLMDRHPNLSLSVKHFPFNSECNEFFPRVMHGNACWAARSAEAAGHLGGEDAFWEWHDWLFLNKGQFAGGKLPSLVEEMGFNRREFTEIMASDWINDLITVDVNEAQDLGIFYTPMIFINGVQHKWVIPGTPSLTHVVDNLAAAIEAGAEDVGPRQPDSKREKYVADWRDARPRRFQPSSDPFHVTYGEGDPVDVLLFGDYTSDRTAAMIEEIKASGVPVNIHMRLYPLEHACNNKLNRKNSGSPGACMAARALKAAGIAGGDPGYQRLHDWALANQPLLPSMDEAAWGAQATARDIDLAEFLDAMTGPQVDALIAEDLTEAARLRFRNVPALYVQGAQVPRPFLENEQIVTQVMLEAQERAKN